MLCVFWPWRDRCILIKHTSLFCAVFVSNLLIRFMFQTSAQTRILCNLCTHSQTMRAHRTSAARCFGLAKGDRSSGLESAVRSFASVNVQTKQTLKTTWTYLLWLQGMSASRKTRGAKVHLCYPTRKAQYSDLERNRGIRLCVILQKKRSPTHPGDLDVNTITLTISLYTRNNMISKFANCAYLCTEIQWEQATEQQKNACFIFGEGWLSTPDLGPSLPYSLPKRFQKR